MSHRPSSQGTQATIISPSSPQPHPSISKKLPPNSPDFSSGIEVVQDEDLPERSPNQYSHSQHPARIPVPTYTAYSRSTPDEKIFRPSESRGQPPHSNNMDGYWNQAQTPYTPGPLTAGGVGPHGERDNSIGGGFYVPAAWGDSSKKMGTGQHIDQQVTSPTSLGGKYADTEWTIERTRRKEKWYWIIIGALILVLVVVAALLGWKYASTQKELDTLRSQAGLGSPQSDESTSGEANKGAENFGSGSNSDSDSDTVDLGKATLRGKGVKKLSSFAASGFFPAPGERAAESGRQYEVQLFFQDEEDYVVTTTLDSRTGSWASKPKRVFKGKAGTPLAAGPFRRNDVYFEQPGGYQHELFHNMGPAGDESLKEWSFSYVGNNNGSLSFQNGFGAGFASGLATYWPSGVWYEGGDNKLAHVWYDLKGSWFSWAEEPTIKSGTRIVAITSKVGSKDEASVFYQNGDGKLEELKWKKSTKSAQGENSAGETLLSLPDRTALAGFSAVASDGVTEDLDLYILYQDGTDIKVYKRVDGTWSGPQSPQELKGADKGTDIACASQYIVTQDQGFGLNRCYFQVNGEIREVGMDSKGSWSVLGTVPS